MCSRVKMHRIYCLSQLGSEVALALQVAAQLGEEHSLQTRVVSMPCRKLFAQQEQAYQQQVLPPQQTRRVVIEAGVAQGWEGYRGDAGLCISVEQFGKSAAANDLATHYGFTVTAIVPRILRHFDTLCYS